MGIIAKINGVALVGTYQGIEPSGDEALDNARLDAVKENAGNAQATAEFITDEEWAAIQEVNKPISTYQQLRAAAYPDYREYLDGIVKGDEVQVQKYIDDCLAVKKRYPK